MHLSLREVLEQFEKEIPLSFQASWDVSGLQVGSLHQKVRRVLFSMDANPQVLKEAATKKIDLIVTHHPLTLTPYSSVDLDSQIGSILKMAIQNNIAIYSAHTSHDASKHSLNRYYADQLKLNGVRPIQPHKLTPYSKLVVFVPLTHTQPVLNALFAAGAGHVGAYSACSFRTSGTGTFCGDDSTNPFLGKKGQLEEAGENRVEVIFKRSDSSKVVAAMLKAHPYEEVAYDILNLENAVEGIGSGIIGELPQAALAGPFVKGLKRLFQAPNVRFTGDAKRKIRSVAICTGSGASLLPQVIRQKADLFITGDVKYHTAIEAENNGVCFADVGHFHSEIRAVGLLKDLFAELFGKKLQLSEYKKLKDPFQYY